MVNNTDMSECHLDCTSAGNKSRINHHVPSHVHRVLKVTFHLVENVFAGAAQHYRARLRVLALHQECEVPDENTRAEFHLDKTCRAQK